jgi:SAM-dependent methyltransferase
VAIKHFDEQKKFAEYYLVPFLQNHVPNLSAKKILEVGCAEAGFLDYLQSIGIDATGIELESRRVELALNLNPTLKVQVGDITDSGLPGRLLKKFDVIVMRDVIEHIQNRQKAFQILDKLLHAGGYLFTSFPPRFSAFAGHQQHARSFLKYIPFVHLLPVFIWRWIGKKMGESSEYINSVIDNYNTGLTINKFEKIYREAGFDGVVKDTFLFRPIFKYRMGLPIVKIPNIYLFREIFSCGCEYLLKKPKN